MTKLRIIDPPSLSDISWVPYSGKGTGYLDWYFCDPRSDEYPIRDLTHRAGMNKKEPNYETLTFNLYVSCLSQFLRGALKRGDSYIFFYTKYIGKKSEYKNKFYITGYYKIVSEATVGEERKRRKAVLASDAVFLDIHDAIPLDDIVGKVTHSRHMKHTLGKEKVDEILKMFYGKKNSRTDYIMQTNQFLKL